MHEVRLPNLGAQMVDAEITEWVVEEGERVEERQVLCVLETEKSSYDLEAEHNGILHIIIEASEDKVPVGELIAVIAESEEEYEKIKSM
jgi:pyruvate/2-oxoglutarate dehydrogenase complex dihydrolipoamide acyltransferase (E2) component